MAVNTYALAEAQYLDNLDYDTDNSVAKCKLFIAACRALLHFVLSSTSTATSSMGNEPQKYREEIDAATDWVGAHDEDAATSAGSGFVRHADISEFRD